MRRRQITLLYYLGTVLVAQIILAIGIAAYVSFQSTNQALQNSSRQILERTINQAQSKLDNYLETAISINQINKDLASAKLLDINNTAQLQKHLWAQFQAFPQVLTIAHGYSNGSILGYTKKPTGESLLITTNDSSLPKGYYTVNAQGQAQTNIRLANDLDISQQEWYQMAAMSGRSSWHTGRDFYPPQTRITRATPHNADTRGVWLVDIGIEQINQALNQLTEPPVKLVCILNRRGNVIAASGVSTTPAGAIASQNSLTNQVVRWLDQQLQGFISIEQNQFLTWPSGRMFAEITPYPNSENLNWLIVAVSSGADPVWQALFTDPMTTLLTLLMCLALAWLILLTQRWVVRPIQAIVKASPGAHTPQVIASSPIKEIGLWANSLSQLLDYVNSSCLQMSHALAKAEEKFTKVFHSSPDGIVILTVPGHCFLDANESFFRLTGYSRPEVINRTYQELPLFGCCPESFSSAQCQDETSQSGLETGLRAKSGQEIAVLLSIESIELAGRPCVLVTVKDLRDQQAITAALHQSEAKNQAIIAALPDVMYVVDHTGVLRQYIGNSPEIDVLEPGAEPIGKNCLDFLPAHVAQQFLAAVHKALETKEVQIHEKQLWIRGRLQYEEVRIAPLNDTEAICMVRDITDRKNTETALRHSEAKNRAILQAIPDLMFIVNYLGIYQGYINNNVEINCLPADLEIAGKSMFEFMPEDLARQRLELIHKALAEKKMQVCEYTNWNKGKLQYEEIRIVPFTETEVVCIVRDINDRKAAEAALRHTEAKNRAILESISDLMFVIDRHGNYLDYKRSATVTDVIPTDEEPTGKNISNFLPQDLFLAKLSQIQDTLRTGTLGVYEQQLYKNGQLHYEEVRMFPIDEEKVLVMVRDITDRKLAEEALRQSEARFRGAFDTTAVGMAIVTPHGEIQKVNQSLCQMLGYQETELLSLRFQSLVHPEDLPQAMEIAQDILDQKVTHGHIENRYFHQQGHVVWGILSLSLVWDTQGQPLYYVAQIQNITQQKQAESSLRQANQELEHLAKTDALTKIANRRHFDQYLEQEWMRLRREQQPLSLLLIDVDYFKLYNDCYGHQAGDICLVAIAKMLSQIVHRSTDVVARYGGEEFAVILPATDRAGAIAVAQKIQTTINKLAISHEQSQVAKVITLSIGIACMIPSPDNGPDKLIQAADQAMYIAKQRGRNQYAIGTISPLPGVVG